MLDVIRILLHALTIVSMVFRKKNKKRMKSRLLLEIPQHLCDSGKAPLLGGKLAQLESDEATA